MSLKQLILPAFCLALGPLAGIHPADPLGHAGCDPSGLRTHGLGQGAEGAGRHLPPRHKERHPAGGHPFGHGGPMLVGGAVLVENVFSVPGMGRLATTALFSKDYAVVQGVVSLVAIIVVFSNLLVDISYGYLDPRVRVS